MVLVVAARGLEGPHSSELTWKPKERDRKRVREGSGSPRRGKGFVGTMLITLPLLAARESQLLLGGGGVPGQLLSLTEGPFADRESEALSLSEAEWTSPGGQAQGLPSKPAASLFQRLRVGSRARPCPPWVQRRLRLSSPLGLFQGSVSVGRPLPAASRQVHS